ncbi:MAG TPA: Ig-like domain-containing protein, partial [Planctomycetota bacterium]|nr:Ig-like domain-containing protein [Planctomycetota bacterium]
PAGTGYIASFRNQAPPVAVIDAAALTVTDSDQTSVTDATIVLSGILDAGQESVDVTVAGAIAKSWNAGTSTLTLSGMDTVAQYQAMLRTLTYVNTATVVTDGVRTITVAVDDGEGLGPVATATVNVYFDTPPTAIDTTILAVEGVTTQGMLAGSDPENAALTWQIVTVPASGTLSLNAATGLVTYVPVLGVTGDVTFTFRVFDGWSWSVPATATVRITPRLTDVQPQIVSAPPRLGWLGAPLSYFVVVDVGFLPAGANLSFTLVGVPVGSTATLTKTNATATTATLIWTATGTPDEHQQLGVLVSDTTSGTSSYQPIQVLWRTLPGGPG